MNKARLFLLHAHKINFYSLNRDRYPEGEITMYNKGWDSRFGCVYLTSSYPTEEYIQYLEYIK